MSEWLRSSLGVVALLLALLVWKVAFADKRGARLVDSIKGGKRPATPAFRLSVIWPHVDLWPAPLCRALSDGFVSPDEMARALARWAY